MSSPNPTNPGSSSNSKSTIKTPGQTYMNQLSSAELYHHLLPYVYSRILNLRRQQQSTMVMENGIRRSLISMKKLVDNYQWVPRVRAYLHESNNLTNPQRAIEYLEMTTDISTEEMLTEGMPPIFCDSERHVYGITGRKRPNEFVATPITIAKRPKPEEIKKEPELIDLTTNSDDE